MLGKEPPTFRCRCSALGQLMTPAKAKGGGLSETAKSMLVTWYKEKLYGRKKEIQSKYMTKGNTCEDAAIEYINKLYGTDHKKNEDHFEDTYLHGTPDIIGEDVILDIKNSWDFTTFPLFSSYLPNRDYMYQLQGYMMLTGKRKGAIVYTLMDLPDDQIELEYRRSGGTGLVTPEFKANYKYADIADKLRVKRFDIDYDEELATAVLDKVEEARKFIGMLKY
jgi:hypothetical protein